MQIKTRFSSQILIGEYSKNPKTDTVRLEIELPSLKQTRIDKDEADFAAFRQLANKHNVIRLESEQENLMHTISGNWVDNFRKNTHKKGTTQQAVDVMESLLPKLPLRKQEIAFLFSRFVRPFMQKGIPSHVNHIFQKTDKTSVLLGQ